MLNRFFRRYGLILILSIEYSDRLHQFKYILGTIYQKTCLWLFFHDKLVKNDFRTMYLFSGFRALLFTDMLETWNKDSSCKAELNILFECFFNLQAGHKRKGLSIEMNVVGRLVT